MRHKDPILMRRIRDFAEDFYFSEGRSPSTTEIASQVGIARSTVYRYLVEMDQKGIISYKSGEIVTEKTQLLSPHVSAEVYEESIPCGNPDEVNCRVDEYVKLPTSIFGSGDYFIIKAQGESMIEAGIRPGDLIVADRNKRADVGCIVVAETDSGSTLKRLHIDHHRKQYVLHPENRSMKDIYVDPENLRVHGVARFVIRSL